METFVQRPFGYVIAEEKINMGKEKEGKGGKINVT